MFIHKTDSESPHIVRILRLHQVDKLIICASNCLCRVCPHSIFALSRDFSVKLDREPFYWLRLILVMFSLVPLRWTQSIVDERIARSLHGNDIEHQSSAGKPRCTVSVCVTSHKLVMVLSWAVWSQWHDLLRCNEISAPSDAEVDVLALWWVVALLNVLTPQDSSSLSLEENRVYVPCSLFTPAPAPMQGRRLRPTLKENVWRKEQKLSNLWDCVIVVVCSSSCEIWGEYLVTVTI